MNYHTAGHRRSGPWPVLTLWNSTFPSLGSTVHLSHSSSAEPVWPSVTQRASPFRALPAPGCAFCTSPLRGFLPLDLSGVGLLLTVIVPIPSTIFNTRYNKSSLGIEWIEMSLSVGSKYKVWASTPPWRYSCLEVFSVCPFSAMAHRHCLR